MIKCDEGWISRVGHRGGAGGGIAPFVSQSRRAVKVWIALQVIRVASAGTKNETASPFSTNGDALRGQAPSK